MTEGQYSRTVTLVTVVDVGGLMFLLVDGSLSLGSGREYSLKVLFSSVGD